MPTQRKIFTVQNLAQKLKDAKSLVLADYRGLSVEQMSQLRQETRKAGGEIEVVKNRLLRIAAKEAKIKLDDQALTGPTIVVWAFEDELEPLKKMDKISKEFGLPKAKSGLFEGIIISAEQVSQLAKIPGKEELQGNLVGSLYSPLYGLHQSMTWNLKKLVYALSAIKENKSN